MFSLRCQKLTLVLHIVYDGSAFQHLVEGVADEMLVLAEEGFEKLDWFPANLRVCQRGEWNDRMMIETVLSMLTLVCGFKKVLAPWL